MNEAGWIVCQPLEEVTGIPEGMCGTPDPGDGSIHSHPLNGHDHNEQCWYSPRVEQYARRLVLHNEV